ncbi:hypothetical protein PENSPDRAFT_666532 [Peniophora sp. CONT]|nr:hypothetical protein PENSPDRAFT_666532 [Peniophora sp. CONT]
MYDGLSATEGIAVDAAKLASISLDNQPVIRASEQPYRAQPGHYLLDEFRKMVSGTVVERDAPPRLLVQWVSGHDDAELNELTDSEAKRAAGGESSPAADLPPMLRKYPPGTLPASVAAVHQEYDRRIKERWDSDWKASERYPRLQHIAPTAPAPKFMRVFQMRVGHAPLNAHLRRCKAAVTAVCVACFEDDETVGHYLYECPAYDRERVALRQAAGEEWDTEGYVLGEEKMGAHLAKYIHATGRFARERGTAARDQGRQENETGGDDAHDV